MSLDCRRKSRSPARRRKQNSLIVNAQAGNDTINASGLSAATSGSQSTAEPAMIPFSEVPVMTSLIGGDGNDSVDGNQGSDTALLGNGNDVFQWDPGDGSDVVEGQAGTDTLLFNGSKYRRGQLDISANGSRVGACRECRQRCDGPQQHRAYPAQRPRRSRTTSLSTTSAGPARRRLPSICRRRRGLGRVTARPTP